VFLGNHSGCANFESARIVLLAAYYGGCHVLKLLLYHCHISGLGNFQDSSLSTKHIEMSLKAALCGSYASHLTFYAPARAQFVRETSLPLAQSFCFVFSFSDALRLCHSPELSQYRELERRVTD
jgi:hypothetical protein